MNARRIGAMTHTLTTLPYRRDILRGLAGAVLSRRLISFQDTAAARKKKRRKHKHGQKQPRVIPCSKSCSDAFDLCVDRPEGRPLCVSTTFTTNCVNCATDQDCLATPQTPYCTTGATERATAEPIPLDQFCPQMIVGVCSQLS